MTPLRSAAFRRVWCSSLAASATHGMERTATAWLALEAGGGAFGVGLVFAARMLPSLLLGLVAGTVADRAGRARQLLAVALAGLVSMGTFGWLVGLGPARAWQPVTIAFVFGCLQTFDTPARQTLVTDTVAPAAAARALALNALAARLAVAIGALLIGALIPLLGVARCYLVIAAAYGLGAVLVAGVRPIRAPKVVAAPPPFLRAMREAAGLIVAVPAVRTLSIAGIAAEVFAFSHGSALPIVAHDVLGAGAAGLGALNAAAAIGGTVAVAGLAALPGTVRREPLLGGVFILYGLSLLALASARSLPAAIAILAVTGLCAAAFDLLQQTLIQLAVPEEQRGRAVGIWVLGLGSAPAGHLEMGALAAALGAPGALAINGALTLLSAGILLGRAPEYRWAARAGGRVRAAGR